MLSKHNHIHFSRSSAFVLDENIKDFVPNRDKYSKKGKGTDFAAGLEELEALLKEPKVNLSGDDNNLDSIITIKKENPRIKIEPDGAADCDGNFVEVKKVVWSAKGNNSNKKIIDELTAANTENQRLYFNLQNRSNSLISSNSS